MASAIKANVGTPVVFKDSGGDAVITLSSLANGSGRLSARLDLGAYPRPLFYRWYMEAQWVATPTADKTLDLYAGFWDDESTPAKPWAQIGSSDAALTATMRKNLKYIDSVVVESAAVGPFSKGGIVMLPTRHLSIAVYNDGGAALASSGTYAASVRFTPIYPEAQ